MATPQLSHDQIALVSGLVAQYIEEQRAKYVPRAVSLDARLRLQLKGFFSSGLLEDARVLVLGDERVSNPDFYPMLSNWGFDNLPDQSRMNAITFLDTVVSHGPFNDRLRFHELVHVEQYRQLGIAKFSGLYVRGFLAGGSYEAIPLERNAYDLDGRFEKNPARRFSVADEIAAWIAEGRF